MLENNILILEDNLETAQLMQDYLVECDFQVDIQCTVTDAISNIKFKNYDLILLDLNLPDFNGTEVLKFLNKNNITIPIIVISAYSEMKTKLKAFKYGASDYMQKPIDLDELEARMWVHINNSSQFSHQKKSTTFEIINNEVSFHNKILSLTKIELEIIKILINNKNNLISREELSEQLSSKSNARSLDYHIKNIRTKIGDTGSNPTYLITEYGLGYKLKY